VIKNVFEEGGSEGLFAIDAGPAVIRGNEFVRNKDGLVFLASCAMLEDNQI